MLGRRDSQTVTPAGVSLAQLPEGTVVRDLITHTDDRGTVCELYDPRWGLTSRISSSPTCSPSDQVRPRVGGCTWSTTTVTHSSPASWSSSSTTVATTARPQG